MRRVKRSGNNIPRIETSPWMAGGFREADCETSLDHVVPEPFSFEDSGQNHSYIDTGSEPAISYQFFPNDSRNFWYLSSATSQVRLVVLLRFDVARVLLNKSRVNSFGAKESLMIVKSWNQGFYLIIRKRCAQCAVFL